MSDNDVRQTLEELIRKSGEDYASLSRMLGRNPTYIQQFVKRGVPRRLHEDDRRTLSRHFGVPEAVLGGPKLDAPPVQSPARAPEQLPDAGFLLLPPLEMMGHAGPPQSPDREAGSAAIAFRLDWVRQLTRGAVDGLTILRVEGDSMHPTLSNGDHILLDTEDRIDRVRDGLYALRVGPALLVKRLSVNPSTRKLSVRSDNPAYPHWDECDPDTIALVGRVVWVGRCLA
jgi:hypothetical protein